MQSSVVGALLVLTRTTRAETFLSVEEAQTLIWPKSILRKHMITVTASQAREIKSLSGMSVHRLNLSAWRSAEGDWFLLDQIIGKHEFIDLAVGISRAGMLAGVEVLTYRESYGGEVRNAKWRAQFQGKSVNELPLKLDQAIKNISGATLSCRHITDGVNRLLATWQTVLRQIT